MASRSVFIILTVILPAVAFATDFIVGDEAGWTKISIIKRGQWKKFYVFQYPVGVHNVFKVNGTGFQYCTKPPLKEALTTGNDTIVLATPGRKWYICGVAQHCALAGQKLAITVNSMAPAPSVYPSMTYGPSQAMP
ncbi:unnamed protein product [Ilex paraguariensis]|uniref:Phytocyanin domain-containing protein n=1 Tax=Ilex paraguariensis TaxID=185542 RepID=A0ABC8QTZ0_9AQUA